MEKKYLFEDLRKFKTASANMLGSEFGVSTNYKSANNKKDWGSQFVNLLHLRKVRISNKLFKSANLPICDLRKLFAESLPLINNMWG